MRTNGQGAARGAWFLVAVLVAATAALAQDEAQDEVQEAREERPADESSSDDAGAQEPAPAPEGAPGETPDVDAPPGDVPAGAQAGVVDPGAAAETPAPEAAPPPRYHSREEAEALASAWLGTGLAERIPLGSSAGGLPLVGVQFGGWGQTPLSERTCVLLVGGLDGVSLAGSEAVLRVVDRLLATPERLPEDVTFVALPWANPDGLARWRETRCGSGRNGRPLDDDRDGRADEDGPDDLDADGLLLEMLLPQPEGAWVRSGDGRFLRPAHPGEAPRFTRTTEGRDDDGDGRYNEDGPGGVALERNFPVHWAGPLVDPAGGPWPLSEPETRGLAELALARRTALALFFQGNHGRLAMPGGTGDAGPAGDELPLPLRADEPAYRALAELLREATGRPWTPVRLAEARGEDVAGAPVDWLYLAAGVLAAEVSVWGPGFEEQRRGGETPDVAPTPGVMRIASGEERELAGGEPGLAPVDRAWARWLDDTRGGLGFVDWQPVDLGDGRQGLVGGWEPYTCWNPPPKLLPQALEGLERFVLSAARALPRLQVRLEEARRDGSLCVLRARAVNAGALATGVGPAAPRRGVTVRLELPEGVRLLAGEALHELGHLPGRGTSGELSWLLAAPEGSVFRLVVESPWCAPARREVRL